MTAPPSSNGAADGNRAADRNDGAADGNDAAADGGDAADTDVGVGARRAAEGREVRPVQRLPIHRVVFRAIVLGATGGFAGGMVMLLGATVRPDSSLQPQALAMFLVIGVVWCGLLAFSEQLVRPLRPGLRPVALGLVGALSALASGCCVVAVEELMTSGSSTQAWFEVVKLLGDLLDEAPEKLLIGLATLAPFSALGAARVGLLRRGETRFRVQLGMALLGGTLCMLLFSGLNDELRSLWGFVTFAGGAGAAALGMALGEGLERRLLVYLRRVTDPSG